MKKKLLLIGALMFMITGCADKNEQPTTEETIDDRANIPVEDREKVAVLLKDSKAHNTKLGTEITNALWQRGYNIMLQYAEGDAKTQADQVASMANEDIKCIIISPVDSEGLNFESLEEAGIPVVNIEGVAKNTKGVDFAVKYDDTAAGELVGDYIIERKDLDKAQGLTIEFLMGSHDDVINDFYTGIMNKLEKYIDSGALICRTGRTSLDQCITNANTPVEVVNDFARYLSGYYGDDLDILVTGADYIANGCDAYLASGGYTNENFPTVTGFGGDTSSIIDFNAGFLSMTAFKNCKEEADICAEAADKLILGEFNPRDYEDKINNNTEDIPAVILEPKSVTNENYQAELYDSGYLTDKEIYG